MPSIEERVNRTSSTWRVIWYENRRRQFETLPSAAEAESFRMLVEGSGNRWPHGWIKGLGFDAALRGPSFREWAEEAVNRRSKASDRAKDDYRRDLAKWAYPLFGDKAVEALHADDSDRMVAAMITAGRSAKTITNVHGTVSSIIADAMVRRPPLIDHNPFRGRLSDLPDVRLEEMVFLTPGEFDTVTGHVPDFYLPLATALVGTGLRYGEATALQARDLTLTGRRKTLSVVRAWKRIPGGSYELGEPKTRRARRTLNLSPALVELFAAQSKGKRATELLFPARNGGQLLNSTFHDIGWAPAVAWASVCAVHGLEQQTAAGKPLRRRALPTPCGCPGTVEKQPRVHDLRHTYAAWLIAEGLPLSVISRRMGHASISTTDNRYGHVLPDLDDQVNLAIDRALRFG
jgi:integrase